MSGHALNARDDDIIPGRFRKTVVLKNVLCAAAFASQLSSNTDRTPNGVTETSFGMGDALGRPPKRSDGSLLCLSGSRREENRERARLSFPGAETFPAANGPAFCISPGTTDPIWPHC